MTSNSRPNSQEKTIFPVILACDSRYIPYMAVCLFSIVMNARTPNVLYKIYLLHTDFTNANIHFLQRVLHSANNPNVELSFVKIDNFNPERFHQNGSYISVSTYYRLLIPMLFTNYDKILYLDGDIVVTADVFELNSVELNNNLVAGCYDNYINRCVYEDVHRIEINQFKMNMNCFDDSYAYQKLKIKPGNTNCYFNAGVLLFNLKRFRELNIETEYFKTILDLQDPIFMDQDIINHVHMKYADPRNMIHLDNRFNRIIYAPTWYSYYPGKVDDAIDCLFNKFETYVKNYLPPSIDKSIFHYIGSTKPWNLPISLSHAIWWGCVLAMPNAQEYKDKYGYCEELDFLFNYFKDTLFTYPRKTNDQIDFSKYHYPKAVTYDQVPHDINNRLFSMVFYGIYS